LQVKSEHREHLSFVLSLLRLVALKSMKSEATSEPGLTDFSLFNIPNLIFQCGQLCWIAKLLYKYI
jgi:hypothetical protein